MSKAKFDAAKELIQEGKFDEAKAILKTIDHPQARKWEAELNAKENSLALEPLPTEVKKSRRNLLRLPCVVLIMAISVCVVVLFFAVNPESRRTVEATTTARAIALRATEQTRATNVSLTPPAASATIKFTPDPSLTPTITNTPRPTSTPSPEQKITSLWEELGFGIWDIERLSINDIGSPKLLAMDFPMPEGFSGYDVGLSETMMLQMACALYQNGFDNDWRFQLSAMVNLVSRATGQESRDDGLTIRITTEQLARVNCENVFAIDAVLLVGNENYSLHPALREP